MAHVTQNERRALEIEQAAWSALNEIGVNGELDFLISPTKLACHWNMIRHMSWLLHEVKTATQHLFDVR